MHAADSPAGSETTSASGHQERLKRLSSQNRLEGEACEQWIDEDDTDTLESKLSALTTSESNYDEELNNEDEEENVFCDTSEVLKSSSDVEQDLIVENNTNCSKQKLLIRSEALCDEGSNSSSPPIIISCDLENNTTLEGSAANTDNNVQRLSPSPVQSSGKKISRETSEGSMESCHTPSISRDNSTETYTDSTGVDLEEFIKKTLNKNPKDRQMLYGLEHDLTDFINDTGSTRNSRPLLKFPAMTSYHRMLVHRVAAFFGLEHNVDQTGKCIVVNKTINTRIPDFKFKDQSDSDGGDSISNVIDSDEPRAKRILQRERDSLSTEEMNTDREAIDNNKKSKSFEERAEQYAKARHRIFDEHRETQSLDQISAFARMHMSNGGQRIWSGDGQFWAEPRPWSSTDSSGYGTDAGTTSKTRAVNQLGGIPKASSFNILPQRKNNIDNIGMDRNSLISRPSLVLSTPIENQSQSIEQNNSQLFLNGDQPVFANEQGNMAIWVASNVDNIPMGSIIINPNTGMPFMNQDGSVYRWQGQNAAAQPAPVDPGGQFIQPAQSSQRNIYQQQEEGQPHYPLTPQSSTESQATSDVAFSQQINTQVILQQLPNHHLQNNVYIQNAQLPTNTYRQYSTYQNQPTATTQQTGQQTGPQNLGQASTTNSGHIANGSFIANENGAQIEGQQYSNAMTYDPTQYLNAGQTQFPQSSQSYEQIAALYTVAQPQHFVNNSNQSFNRPAPVQYYQLPHGYIASAQSATNAQHPSNYVTPPLRNNPSSQNVNPPTSVSPQQTSTPPNGVQKVNSSPIRSPANQNISMNQSNAPTKSPYRTTQNIFPFAARNQHVYNNIPTQGRTGAKSQGSRGQGQRLRRTRSKEMSSPQTSVDKEDTNDTNSHVFTLLINDLPSSKSDIMSLLCPLTRLGAKLYREPNDMNAAVALFDSETSAISATTNSCLSNCRVQTISFDHYTLSSLEPIT